MAAAPPRPAAVSGDEHRFYGELAVWWPLISPPADYAEEAAFSGSLLRTGAIPVATVLELGSGGGHNAVHLKEHFTLTLVDRSPPMLAMSQRLNPECLHVEGDMRTVRLARKFDAVFVHDAVAYMTTAEDLRAAMATAFAHVKPGGVAVFAPDDVRETFVPDDDHGGHDGEDGRGVRYLEWSWDPDPSDSWFLTEYVFLLREPDGSVRSVHETHRNGLFAGAEWLRFLGDAGFAARAVPEETTEDRRPRLLFVGQRPASAG
jgi:SAM-dependent methyltransferase